MLQNKDRRGKSIRRVLVLGVDGTITIDVVFMISFKVKEISKKIV